LLITKRAVADELLDDQPVCGLPYLAKGGVHREEGQQCDEEQPGDAGVPVVDFPLIFG
jgi:hypothetical protein